MIESAYLFIYDRPLGAVFFVVLLLFMTMYFSFGFLFERISHFLVRKNLAEKVSSFPHFKNQYWFEIRHGLISIFLFAIYGVVITWLVRQGTLRVVNRGAVTLFIDLFILIAWNEIHFYIIHRLMHTRLFLPVHRVHHKSVVVTPFSAYSFHPVESFLNGSVMIIPMFFHDFELRALIALPVYSVIFNMAGHSNTRLIFFQKLKHRLSMSTRHNQHHTSFNTNFGFATPFFDMLFLRKKRTKSQR